MSDDHDSRRTPPPADLLDDENKNDDMFQSAVMTSTTVDVSLSGADDDDDDENPFGTPSVREKTPTTTTNIVEAAHVPEKDVSPPEMKQTIIEEPKHDLLEDDPFGSSKPEQTETISPVKKEDEEELFSSPTKPVSTPPVTPIRPAPPVTPMRPAPPASPIRPAPPVSPSRPAPSIETPIETSTPTKTNLSDTVTIIRPATKRIESNDIEIVVGNPHKVGDGMSSYMAYAITTKTQLPSFKKSEFTVNRRFSDFLGLQNKLVHKHLHNGLILPSPPEKDSISMAKVKISKEDSVPSDFLDRRRALLERYLNRLVRHSKLIEDTDLREFIEYPNDLPKSTNTTALSGAGVLRAFSTISTQVSKLTTKKSEQDQWFEEKHHFIVEIQSHLKHLYNQMNNLLSHRKDAASTLKSLSVYLNHLATIEEHPLLSSALVELANLEEKLDQTQNEIMMKEYSTLTELVKEYVSLLEMVQLAFYERIKAHQQWLNAEDTLKKKRDTKAQLEQSGKGADKLPRAEMEINEWEGKVVKGKEDFERISVTIKEEMEVFEQNRFVDFKQAIEQYLQNSLEQQEKILQIWEHFLPEANKINI